MPRLAHAVRSHVQRSQWPPARQEHSCLPALYVLGYTRSLMVYPGIKCLRGAVAEPCSAAGPGAALACTVCPPEGRSSRSVGCGSSPPKEARQAPAARPHCSWLGPLPLPAQPRPHGSCAPVASMPPWLPCRHGPRAPAPLLRPRGCSPHQGCCWVPATAGAVLSQKPSGDGHAAGNGDDRELIPSGSPSGRHCCGWKPFTATAVMAWGARPRGKAARPPLPGNIKDTGHRWCRGWGKRGSTWSWTLALLWH